MNKAARDLGTIAREAYLEAARLGLSEETERLAFAVVVLVKTDAALDMPQALEIARDAARPG